jgi:hypothetical protein
MLTVALEMQTIDSVFIVVSYEVVLLLSAISTYLGLV